MPGLARLRAAIARAMVATLLLPAAFGLGGADPEWMLGIDAAGDESARHAALDHRHESADDGKDYSIVPCSPGHPADHNCNPCQVLKYLASYLPQLPLLLPAGAPSAFPPLVRREAQRAGHVASLPPSRAPPKPAV